MFSGEASHHGRHLGQGSSYLLEQVLLANANAPVTLALERAGVQTASDLMSLEVSQDMPLKYDHPAEGADKAKKNVPLLPAEICQIKGLKDYIRYHMTNVANKYYESCEEKFTAKGFIRFRITISPTLPPNEAPSAQVTKPPPVINDPLQDWKKGIKCDMSIFKEMKRTKEWEQWDVPAVDDGSMGSHIFVGTELEVCDAEAKGFIRFRITISPTLPPNEAPSAQVTKPPPVINDPLQDWKKGIKCDMSIFKEMKRTKEWEQWDVPAVDDGSMGSHIFVGTELEVCDAEGLKSSRQFVNSLEGNIRKCGAMDKLLSDQAQTKIGMWAQDILRALFILSWQSEPHQEPQNPAERKYQMLKQYTNTILSHTGAPANTWLLCLLYVCFESPSMPVTSVANPT